MSQTESTSNSTPSAGWTSTMRGVRNWLELERGLSSNSLKPTCGTSSASLSLHRTCPRHPSPPGEFAPEHVDGFIAQLFEEGLSRNSQSRILSGVRNFCKYLLLEGILERDPLELVDSPPRAETA